jgi:PTH1 family peptidyl-tRNA hydrolase
MTLIVGLGNPGSKYQDSRHNIGFLVIDAIIKELNSTPINKKSFNSLLYKSDDLLFAKPQTYMNLSGESVSAISRFYKCDKIITIHDDLELDFGAIRYKQGGGNGGHNGLKSIDSMIGKEYLRVRIGISKPENKHIISSYVLSKFSDKQSAYLDDIISYAKDGALRLIKDDVSIVSSCCTRKKYV